MPFKRFGFSSHIVRAVDEAGFATPPPIQAAAMPHVLEGRDLIGIAQTGTGKTAAFVLPLLELLARAPQPARRTPRVLIVAPTRELAAQIDESVRSFAKHLHLRCVTIFGGVGETPQIQAVRRGADILVATPGRLLDLMAQRHVSLADVKFVVLDEAEQMLDMGFLPQIRKVIAALPKERQTLLFSATLSKDIERIASEMLRNPETVEIGRRTNPAETVEQSLYPVPKSRKVDLLLHLLRDKNLDSVLVFSRTKHGADKIARKLAQAKVTATTLHSNRSQGQRTAALAAFRAGRVRVLVATDIAARGIDVAGISPVVHFDFPPQPEDYVHRIGRTGRAEAVGDAISFVTGEDEANVRALEKQIRRSLPRRRIEGFDYTESAPLRVFHPQQQRPHPSPQSRGPRQSSSIRRSSSSR